MFGKNYFCQLILLFILFLLLFMGSIILFDTIYGSYCTISANFYHSTFSKSFQFQQNKWIPKQTMSVIFAILFYYLSYFYYYLWVILYFLILFMGLIVLFQLTFNFTFSKKLSILVKSADLNKL